MALGWVPSQSWAIAGVVCGEKREEGGGERLRHVRSADFERELFPLSKTWVAMFTETAFLYHLFEFGFKTRFITRWAFFGVGCGWGWTRLGSVTWW